MEQAATADSASPDQRRAALAQRVATFASDGWRIETQTDYQAVLVKGRRPNHLLHLVLTLVTLGLWLFVWVGLAIFGGEKRLVLMVDDAGNVSVPAQD